MPSISDRPRPVQHVQRRQCAPRLFSSCLFILLCLVPVLLCTGCEEEDRHNTVRYEISGGNIKCFDTCDTSEFTYDDYHTFTCIWCCADYKGRNDIYVSITFKDTGSTWVIESEYISGGICGSKGGMITAPAPDQIREVGYPREVH